MAAVDSIKTTEISLIFYITNATMQLYAEWHFFALSYGKNACDSIGGTIKQVAAYASLQ